jgi:hypothetical protein
MDASTFRFADVPDARRATGYRLKPDGTYAEEPPLPHGVFGSMGGLLTTANDLGKYVAFHLSAWPPRDDEDAGPVRRSSVREMAHLWTPSNLAARLVNDKLQASETGYGFGLRVTSDCRFEHIVAHGGGLPGFGSVMTWLPEYGVGIIAFGNLTYTSWGRVATNAFERLTKEGGLKPRMPAPSPALTRARDAVSRLIVRWDDRLADEVAAENLFLDQSKERRRAEIDRLRASTGACTEGTGFDAVENALRGTWTISCERGKLQVAITLAPTMPPKVQFLSVRAAPSEVPRADACPQ